MMREPKRATGRIISVQETRFRLVAEDGRSFLFTLGHGAFAAEAGLIDLHKARASVTIEYEGEPQLESGVARSIRVIRWKHAT
ncbi:MAG: hypothetical protein WAM73_19595 [Desulfobacterales bacterium]